MKVSISVNGAPEPATGTVEDVTLRITRVRSPNGEVVIVPNAVRSATVALRGRAQSDEGRTAVRGALASLGPALVRIFDPRDLVSMHAGTKLGDFVVEARPPYGFAVSLPFAGLSRAAHGSTGELTVPLLVSGPGFRAGRALRDPRLVDVAATAAALAGGGIADLPGEPLLER